MWNNASNLFALVDDARGGRLQVFKRKLKLRLRLAWFRRDIEKLKRYFESQQLLALPLSDPRIYLKCTRSYLWNSLSGGKRLEAQLAFYEWLLSRHAHPQIDQFYQKNRATICAFAVKDRLMEVLMRPARGLGREGELAIYLSLDGQMLMKASFTVLPLHLLGLKGSGHAVFIGAFQGQKKSLELFKDATQLMERTKPAHLLFNALQGIARTWDLQSILGVSDSLHAYADYKTTLAKRVKTNYDEVWQELGGVKMAPGDHWVLPLTWVPRPESEIESKKRSAYRRRNALRQAFLDACTHNTAHQLLANH